MPRGPHRSHKPRIYICNNRITRRCHEGFSTMSGLSRHRNTTHPLPKKQPMPAQPMPTQLPPLAFPPPPDDMYLNDDENNPGPHEAFQGEILRHPILNGMSSICTFCSIFISLLSRNAMRFPRKLPTSSYSSPTSFLTWRR